MNESSRLKMNEGIGVIMKEGAEYELYAHALAHDGRAICRLYQPNSDALDSDVPNRQIQGQVVFVPYVLPAQKIIARIVKVKKKYALGELVKILQAPTSDAHNALEICAHADNCGGCILQKMPYSEQLFWKEKILLDSIQRIANIKSCEIKPILPSPKLWDYRNKMQFAFAGNQGDLSLGLRIKSSHEVINIEQCKLMPELSMQIISKIRELANNLGLSAYAIDEDECTGFLRFVNIRIPLSQSSQPQCLVNIVSSRGQDDEDEKVQKIAKELMLQYKEITGFVHDIRYKNDNFAIGDKTIYRQGQTILCEKLNGLDYKFGHKSFFQINTAAAEFIAQELELNLELSGNEILWDLYSGVGAPSMFLAKKVKQIIGIDSSTQAVKLANENAKINKFSHCNYHVGQVHQIIDKLEKPNVVIMDPPRAGVHPMVISKLLKIKPKQIVYISCDSATLSRDVKLLTKYYEINRIQPLDFFPQTPHVESVVCLKLK